MGNIGSNIENQTLLKGSNQREYLTTSERMMRRYEPYDIGERSAETSTLDASVDKYDYLIVFPATDNEPLTEEEEERQQELKRERISWKEIKEIWYQAVPGGDDVKDKAVNELRNVWISRFRGGEPKDDLRIPLDQWMSLAREVIINMLTSQSGLQLKMSTSMDHRYILCRIRAPVKLLEHQADVEDYRLQFRGEVDPGYAFWNQDEVEEEAMELSKDEANEILEKLYHAGKISPNDLSVFDNEATSKHWSRRIHTLERIADRVPVMNRYPAYAPFDSEGKERHLYQTYPSVRGRTLFRSKDRLLLTRNIIANYFDVGVLEDRGVIECIMALHDANRGERITVEVLFKRWVTFWRADATKIGAPLISHTASDDNEAVSWYLRPFAQPLMEVREYFGEQLALYFAWLGFYSYALIIPALIGLLNEIYILVNGDTSDEKKLDGFQAFTAIFICLWAVVYKESWDRENKVIAVKWGMDGFEEDEKDRPQFRGDPEEPRRRSPITNRMETYYPKRKRKVRQFLSLCLILIAIILLLVAIEIIFYLEYFLEDEEGFWWGSVVCSLISAIQIQILSLLYNSVAVKLNEWENHQTETAYNDNLIFKTFLFQIFNNYSALCYTAFIKDSLYGCSDTCMGDLRELMLSIFIIRYLMNGVEIGLPYFNRMMREKEIEKELNQLKKNDSKKSNIESKSNDKVDIENNVDNDIEPFESEIQLEEYEGTFDDYAEIVLQYGYITMFVTALPAAPFLGLLENMFEMRVDAYKMTNLTRRPDPYPAEDTGMWGTLIEAMGFLCICTNTAIICFTTNTLGNYSKTEQWVIFLVVEHLILALKVLLHIIIPDEPTWLRITKSRQRFIIQKHKHGFIFDQGNDEDDDMLTKGHIDMDDLDLFTLSQGELQVEDQIELEKLRAELRNISRELKTTKEQLQLAYQTEVFNEESGVGETKHGLPLGCLNVKLISLEGLNIEPQDCSIVISLKSTRPGDKTPPGPPPEMSRPATSSSSSSSSSSSKKRKSRRGSTKLGDDQLEFNQAFVLAPIRTQDAEVVFDVMNRSAEHKKQASSKLHLRELSDQKEHDLPLTLKETGQDKPGAGRLYVRVKFMYSKIVPLRTKIYHLQDRKKQIEREIAMTQMGKKK